MVIVEFFGRTPIDNMVATLVNRPDTVIFVGNPKLMKKSDPVFRRFLAATGNTATRIRYEEIRSHDFHEIVTLLDRLASEYPDCHFDITGGAPMVLAAIGVIYERYRSRGIELHQYNLRTGKVYDCDLNGISVSGELPQLTVAQSILLHGGSVVPDRKSPPWDMSKDFCRDIFALWNICKTDCSGWNRRISALNSLRPEPTAHALELSTPLPAGSDSLRLDHMLRRMEREGLLSELTLTDSRLHLRYKNRQVRQSLEKAGNILELYTCAVARSITDTDGRPCYQDSAVGVSIDWDGIIHSHQTGKVDTKNEIDVILMHGAIPVFISCKNGMVEEDELFKLNTVAEHFGGRYVKKVLVATTLGKKTQRSRQYFLERARDMGITVIAGVHKLPEPEFRERLRTLTDI